MAKKIREGVIDCACVIHSTGYDWTYVDRLYNMLKRALLTDIRLHVYTEADRAVPGPYIKHELEEWTGVSGPRRSWWYKMQLFNPEHFAGDLLYFDLDTIILRPITWITQLPTEKFWTIKDFKYLQSDLISEINSSVMWWNTEKFAYVWEKFKQQEIKTIVRTYKGDQDFLHATIDYNNRRYFDITQLESYRWQVLDGGYDFEHRQYKHPGKGPFISGGTSIVVFHGHPKPHEIKHPEIVKLWV
jgi:hypothetical protein